MDHEEPVGALPGFEHLTPMAHEPQCYYCGKDVKPDKAWCFGCLHMICDQCDEVKPERKVPHQVFHHKN